MTGRATAMPDDSQTTNDSSLTWPQAVCLIGLAFAAAFALVGFFVASALLPGVCHG